MRIVAFLDYSSVFAGAERMLYNMIEHIDRKKYLPILIFPYPMEHQYRYDDLDCKKIFLADGKKWWMGSDRWSHPLRGMDFIKRSEFGRRIAKVVKREHIDILDINLMRRDVKMWVWATRRFTDAKIVGHYRSQSQDWVAPADAQRLFDVVACVSKFSQERFRLRGDFTNTTVLYDSIDVDVMKCDMSKADAKVSLGYNPDDILLVSVGQLSRHKGHDTAIRAFASICKKYANAKLLIAGGGRIELAEYYRNLAKEFEIDDRVFIPGEQFANIQTIYRAADLTLSLTKVGEGFGLVPYESALIGTPFIAPCFGAITEFVDDNNSGYLVDTNNLESVIKKILLALENVSESERMIRKLQTIIYERLRPSVLADNMDKLYTSLFKM